MNPAHGALLLLLAPTLAHARRPSTPGTPTIEEVVQAEGFTPTPSQSEMYRPGAVLVPNGRDGHDVVVASCIDAEPQVAVMSQSSIATTLSAGVSARLGAARAGTSATIEKRLTFVDPEQRTIPLGLMVPTAECLERVRVAGGLQDLTDAVVLHDVLVAIIQNTVCSRVDASGSVVALGAAEAAAYSECIQESDAQVPLGYKAKPLSKVLALAGSSLPDSPPPPQAGRDERRADAPRRDRSKPAADRTPAPKRSKPADLLAALVPEAREYGLSIPSRPKKEAIAALEARIEEQRALAAALEPLIAEATRYALSIPEPPYTAGRVEALRAEVEEIRAQPKYGKLVGDFATFCTLDAAGAASCFGVKDDRDAAAVRSPPTGVAFQKLSLGMAVGCGLTTAGKLTCWGEPYNAGVDRPPAGTWADFSHNDNGGCALSDAGRLSCWGGDHYNYRQFKPKSVPRGTYRGVISGDYHHCAIRTDGETVCWGNRHGGDKGGPYTAPAAITELQFAGDGGLTCGVDAENHGWCWSGPGDATRTADRYTKVLVADFVREGDGWIDIVCGIRTDGTLGCETPGSPGRSADEWMSPLPEGRFVDIAADFHNLCALDHIGRLSCWKATKR